MSEVEKMYENAEVKKQIPKICSSNELYCKECEAHIEDAMPYCKNAEYPPFTPEKQLELICWLVNNKDSIMITNEPKPINLEVLKESMAYGINLLWQDLTESEQEQIRSILNG